MELIQRFPNQLINDSKLKEQVDRELPTTFSKTLAFVIQRLGFRNPIDDDHLIILLSAGSYAHRVSLVRLLFEHFEMNQAMVSELRERITNVSGFSRLVWGRFLEADYDADDEPNADSPFARRRTGHSKNDVLHAYEHWRDQTLASFTREEANLDAYQGAIRGLTEVFGLKDPEPTVALALFVLFEIPVKREVFISESIRQISDAVAGLTGIESATVEKIISPAGRLVRFRLIHVDVTNPDEFDFHVEHLLVSLFRGYITKESLTDSIQLIDTASFSLGSFPIAASDRQAIRDLIRSPKARHILIYGEPGTGKTELVRSIIRAERKKAYWVGAVEKNVDGDKANRHSLFDVAVAMAEERGAVLVVDEADQILNTESLFGSSGKGRLVRVFDETPVTTVWIVNDGDAVHDAITRRFHFHLRFEPPRKDVRFQRLSMLLRQAGLSLPQKERRRIAYKYDVSIASLSRAMDTALEARHAPTDGAKPVIQRLETTLAYEHEFVHGSRPLSGNAHRHLGAGKQFLKDALNTSVPVSRVATAIERFYEAKDLAGGATGPLNILFSGPSGTGKTAFAQALAHTVGRKLLFVTAADLLGPHVGETEQAISGMFAKGTSDGAIILMDEAENLLQSRSNAKMGHERQQTNEFLSQMERHGGVFIATTNEKKIIDSAMNRRFSLKVSFAPPVPEHLPKLYRAYFTLPHRRFTPALAARVRDIHDLTPGHIRTVYDRLQFFLDNQTTHEEIIHEIETEVAATLQERSEHVVLGFTA